MAIRVAYTPTVMWWEIKPQRARKSFPCDDLIITTFLDPDGLYGFSTTDGAEFYTCTIRFTFRWQAARHARKLVHETRIHR